MDDLTFALQLADLADAETLPRWSPAGVASNTKADGTPVTEADVAAEQAVLAAVRRAHPDDAFIGEEVGQHAGSNHRRWIVDGIDGTRGFAAGQQTWGTLIALEENGVVAAAVSTSPAQRRRWWATLGGGAYTARTGEPGSSRRLQVGAAHPPGQRRVATLPNYDKLPPGIQQVVHNAGGAPPAEAGWSQQNRVAEGELDFCVWLAGDIWDHAAPSLIVEEAGGRFSDLYGGKRLDTRTALYSNNADHEGLLAALRIALGG